MKKFFKIFISVLILFLPEFYFGINNQTFQMVCVLVPSILSVVLINLEDLKKSIVSIKAKDIEIKFKEVIEEAYATISQLNKIQYTLTKVATETVYRSKFWGGCSAQSTLQIVDELYETAKSTNANVIINGPLKIAYERLVSEAFGHLTTGVNDKDDAKQIDEIIKQIYVFKGNTNIIEDCKNIPNANALKNMINSLSIESKSKEEVFENVTFYETVLKKYQSIYGTVNAVDIIGIGDGENK